MNSQGPLRSQPGAPQPAKEENNLFMRRMHEPNQYKYRTSPPLGGERTIEVRDAKSTLRGSERGSSDGKIKLGLRRAHRMG